MYDPFNIEHEIFNTGAELSATLITDTEVFKNVKIHFKPEGSQTEFGGLVIANEGILCWIPATLFLKAKPKRNSKLVIGEEEFFVLNLHRPVNGSAKMELSYDVVA